MKTVQWIAALAIAGYVAAVVALYVFQRALLYPAPQTTRTDPAAAGFPEAQEVVLDTGDGEKVIVWHVPPKQGKPVVLFFHGNGEVLAWRVPRFRAITADGTGLVALSFRGYGGSSGRPIEAGLLNDGRRLTAFAAAHYPAERIVPWGYSLGSGVAVAIAASQPVGKLILEAPYTSIIRCRRIAVLVHAGALADAGQLSLRRADIRCESAPADHARRKGTRSSR